MSRDKLLDTLMEMDYGQNLKLLGHHAVTREGAMTWVVNDRFRGGLTETTDILLAPTFTATDDRGATSHFLTTRNSHDEKRTILGIR